MNGPPIKERFLRAREVLSKVAAVGERKGILVFKAWAEEAREFETSYRKAACFGNLARVSDTQDALAFQKAALDASRAPESLIWFHILPFHTSPPGAICKGEGRWVMPEKLESHSSVSQRTTCWGVGGRAPNSTLGRKDVSARGLIVSRSEYYHWSLHGH